MADSWAMARRWWLILPLALVTLAACSSSMPDAGSGGSTSGSAPTTAGDPSSSAGDPSSSAGSAGTAISLYFLQNGRIGVGQRQIAATADPPHTAVDLLLRGPTDVDKAVGLTTALKPTTRLNSLQVADGVATADFNRDLEDRDTQPAVAQIVYTLTQFPEITKVKLLIDGLPNGAAGVLAYSRNDLPRLTPDLLIEAPTPGLATPTSVKVRGDIAERFGSFAYRFEAAGGSVVAQGTLNAKFGSAPRKRFDQVVELPPGTTGPLALVVTQPVGSTQPELRIPLTVQ